MPQSPLRLRLLLATAAGLLPCLADAAASCTTEAVQALAPAGMKIKEARAIAAPDTAASWCRIEGTVPTPGNTLRVRIGLPQQWNGKFLFEAVGGGNGVLVDVAPGAQRGYAVATTDAGHPSDVVQNFDFWSNPAQRQDWIDRGVHTTTLGSKALVQAWYARAPQHAYLRGCSNGGRAGLVEAEHYPADYDGIIAGAPAANGGMTLLAWIWAWQALNATPQSRLSPADWELVGRTVREACDAKDGLRDGIIQDPRRCTLPRAQLVCAPGRDEACLGPAKMAALEKLWNKPSLSDGRKLFAEGHGYEDSMMSWAFFAGVPPLKLLGTLLHPPHGSRSQLGSRVPEPPLPLSMALPWLFSGAPAATDQAADGFRHGVLLPDLTIEPRDFDVAKQGAAMADHVNAMLTVGGHPDLSVYLSHGGKLLLWHGLGDVILAPEATYDYYERARSQALGSGLSAAAFDQAVRLYPVPTLGHCDGDSGPNETDFLAALDAWVAQNQRPEAITIEQRKADGSVLRSRPLCPLPQEPRYTGQGSVDVASSFVCAVPADRVGITGLAPP